MLSFSPAPSHHSDTVVLKIQPSHVASANLPTYLVIQVQAEPTPHAVHWIQEALT